ncbi:unnamed protein product [Medioppia subpectinata]|uniref:Methyltransferase type 11 domain-containing protein n=1 Tax=Medioppia subpectinata TaxID=1979941 RepID=A0A7R9KFA2_9ACAR|nr:unnamed protein product [Medioppia subpectinata]CAG2102501.1 unnamed protein product [Medioppia subpectinata]
MGRKTDIIIDIGSGDGATTKVLATRVSHKRVIAIDVNPAMTAYGQSVNSLTTIEYLTQDMSVSWQELSDDVRRLESKVDIIFSNFCFHFIRDKSQLLSICRRLLSTGGIIHANVFLLNDLNSKLPADRQKACFLSIDQQLDVWRRALTDNGFTVDVFTVAEDTFTMAREHAIASFPVIMSIYKTFFETTEEFVRECSDLSDVIFDAMCNPVADRPNPNAWTQFLANEDITEVVYRAQLLTLVAHKKMIIIY